MMSGPMATHASLLFLLISYAIGSFKLCSCTRNHSVFCPEIEKQSLLSFKKSLKDPNKQLSSWNGEVDCCNWKGVVCNDFTGHVHELHLRCNSPLAFQGLSGKVNPSLLNLKHLAFLDLSQNFFNATIPSFIGSFTALEHLNLSNAAFFGKIPHTIGNLSNLHALDLNSEIYSFVDSHGNSRNLLDVDRLEWLLGLSKLEHLNMNGVNLSKAFDWSQVINSLPSLLQLHFRRCNLDFMAPLNDVSVTFLTFLDLSSNNFISVAPLRWIFQLRSLLYLDLSHNFFEGPIQSISNATKLQHIDFSGNYFNSSIPDWIYLCKELEFLSLSRNFLHGTVSYSISNLTSLEFLGLSHNRLSGKIPRETANLSKLQVLNLEYNELEGEISDQFGEFRNLQSLILTHNKLTGNLPESLGQLLNLQNLYISHNMFEGNVTESFFANLTKLEVLSACWNRLSLDVRPNWIPPFQLSTLRLGTWNLGNGSRIPSWLETQRKSLYELDLFNTGMSCSVPNWLWGIGLLDLSHNSLHGNIPYIHNRYLYLNTNRFNGSLPRVGDNVDELNLSDNLFSGGTSHFFCGTTNSRMENLNLDWNQLSGELPDCWKKWPSLKYLSLGNNSISGSIPDSIGFLADLQSLNLYGNKLSGRIPSAMQNCKKLLKINLADNDLDGDLPTWIGTSLADLRILILRSNKLSGKVPPETCRLNSLQILDLSGNGISGTIPRCVYNFTAMATTQTNLLEDGYRESVYSYSVSSGAFVDSAAVTTKGRELQYGSKVLPLVTSFDLSRNNLSGDIPEELTSLVVLISLNLSGNSLTGRIPDSIGDMKHLESLDLSRNCLSGRIPSSMSLLSSLSVLNVSYNKLTGRIPEGTQLVGFDSSSYIGNDLCGLPLRRNCSDGGGGGGNGKGDDEQGSGRSEIEWFYVLLSLGYAVGFSMVCTALVLNKRWRDAYFGLLERMWNKLGDYVYFNWAKLTMPSC